MWLLFFFFFKQKTAYEMRISDWSSDVCSSDLHDTAHADIHRISMKMGEHPGNTGAGHLRCRGGGSNRRRNAIKDEERRRQEPSSYAEHARKHAHNAAKANNDKGIRSEEHTSELQSLMRISYAVFCSKKKNK